MIGPTITVEGVPHSLRSCLQNQVLCVALKAGKGFSVQCRFTVRLVGSFRTQSGLDFRGKFRFSNAALGRVYGRARV